MFRGRDETERGGDGCGMKRSRRSSAVSLLLLLPSSSLSSSLLLLLLQVGLLTLAGRE